MPSNPDGNDNGRDKENRTISHISSLYRTTSPETAFFLSAMVRLATVGCFLIFLYSLCFWASGQLLRIFGVGMLAAGAALLSGFLLGFIFAIPRVGGQKGKTNTAQPTDAQTPDSGVKTNPAPPNENLVEISDWLTKIIVGVGLVELRSIPIMLGKLSYYLAYGILPASFAGGASCAESLFIGQAAGLTILIFYFTLGFLFCYVWTTIYFSRDLNAQLMQLEQQKDTLQRLKQAADKIMPAKASVILSAEASISANQLDKAMASIDEALKNDPNNGLAVMTKARIFKRQASQTGQPERDKLLKQAVACADQAIALLPDKGEPIYNKACYQALLNAKGLKSDVLENLKSAFRLNPGLRQAAKDDHDLAPLKQDVDFVKLMGKTSRRGA